MVWQVDIIAILAIFIITRYPFQIVLFEMLQNIGWKWGCQEKGLNGHLSITLHRQKDSYLHNYQQAHQYEQEANRP